MRGRLSKSLKYYESTVIPSYWRQRVGGKIKIPAGVARRLGWTPGINVVILPLSSDELIVRDAMVEYELKTDLDTRSDIMIVMPFSHIRFYDNGGLNLNYYLTLNFLVQRTSRVARTSPNALSLYLPKSLKIPAGSKIRMMPIKYNSLRFLIVRTV